MAKIFETDTDILLENKYAQIVLSKQDASVLRIWDKTGQKELRGEKTCFFALLQKDLTEVAPTGLSLQGDLLTVTTPLGNFSVQVGIDDDYFTFTLTTALPEGAFQCLIANAKYEYDYTDKQNTGACGIAMTYWVNPVFYPDAKSCETRAEITRHLQDVNGKYALIIAPIAEQRDIIKKVSLTIDRKVGIMSQIGGAWGRDSRMNFGNYLIEFETSAEYIQQTKDYYCSAGIDQVDFHQGAGTFRQGDFKFDRYASAAEFKENVSDVLAEQGIQVGLHTYAFYIDYDCDTILSDPVWQKDLSVLETFTLARDIGPEEMFVPTAESTQIVSDDFAFMARNTPFILIGEELIRFEDSKEGFKVAQRGVAGTKATAHKAGEKIKHIDGYYRVIAPIPGSPLFFHIARDTARAFNEGGFSMIYLDALDGIRIHCGENENWYYTAMFICELLQYCNKLPLIEYSTIFPSIWPARGRVGAYDFPNRGYKDFLQIHAKDNIKYIDRYSAPTLGWYNFYPVSENFPGNEHVKYNHTDAIEFMGTLAVTYDFSTVHTTTVPKFLDRYAGLRRNVALYKKYDDLRKQQYFAPEYLEKVKESPWECHLKETEQGYVFEEKDYQTAKLYDLQDSERNNKKFTNPFAEQVPFIRIEALLSSAGRNPIELISLDENKDLTDQPLVKEHTQDVDLNKKLAKKVRVLGNGKPGSAIAIENRWETFKSNRSYLDYIIDTDFEGWREFVLVETDTGERPDLPFDEGENIYACYRSQMNNRMVSKTQIRTAGDVTGVRMSSVVACEHCYEVLKNPTVQIGDTKVVFECELMSTDYLEFDGKTAKVFDRNGNEKQIWYQTDLAVPAGEFTASLTADPLNGNPARAILTLGFTGKEI
ncbi:MAG: hypothetical protein IJX01_09410 [Oscillospiraceae bacterium]|nr:hypothetical protein [Oscillospiraceae bacterium]MBQ7330100.1 hypothetical protein [Oscillospiraceae bacterium]